MLTAVIVDDEASAVENLEIQIRRHAPQLRVIGSSTDGNKASSLINELKPEVLFLDIEMPGLNGFQLVERLTHRNFFLIFCTAYSTYGIKALRANAVDYLLKPVEESDLQKTVSILMDRSHIKMRDLEQAATAALMAGRQQRKIHVPGPLAIDFVEAGSISMIAATGRYTQVTLTSGQVLRANKSISEYDQLLCEDRYGRFVRVHNSFIVNLDQVIRYKKGENQLVVNPGRIVPVAKGKKDAMIKELITGVVDQF